MTTITKERLQEVIDGDILFTDGHRELARIALASLEAEPVAYIFKHPAGRLFWSLTDESNKGQSDVMPVYTAPPAPEFVPLAIHDEDFEKALSVLNDTLDDCGDSERGLLLALDKAGIEVRSDACRAAMLQAGNHTEQHLDMVDHSGDANKMVAGNSPVTPDCSCRTCRPVTFTDSRFVVCPECGNKRCPHANDHRNACTGSNEPGQAGSAYPAAPQQEVKS